MKYVSAGARGAKYACRETFVVEKWNCDSIRKAPNFDKDISHGKYISIPRLKLC